MMWPGFHRCLASRIAHFKEERGLERKRCAQDPRGEGEGRLSRTWTEQGLSRKGSPQREAALLPGGPRYKNAPFVPRVQRWENPTGQDGGWCWEALLAAALQGPESSHGPLHKDGFLSGVPSAPLGRWKGPQTFLPMANGLLKAFRFIQSAWRKR